MVEFSFQNYVHVACLQANDHFPSEAVIYVLCGGARGLELTEKPLEPLKTDEGQGSEQGTSLVNKTVPSAADCHHKRTAWRNMLIKEDFPNLIIIGAVFCVRPLPVS